MFVASEMKKIFQRRSDRFNQMCKTRKLTKGISATRVAIGLLETPCYNFRTLHAYQCSVDSSRCATSKASSDINIVFLTFGRQKTYWTIKIEELSQFCFRNVSHINQTKIKLKSSFLLLQAKSPNDSSLKNPKHLHKLFLFFWRRCLPAITRECRVLWKL